jgi:hypothetical protein
MTSIREAADLPDVAVAVDEEPVVVPELPLPDSVVSEEPVEVVVEEPEDVVVVLAAEVVVTAADPLAVPEAALVALTAVAFPPPLAALALPEVAGPVELLTNGKSGVKLYPSGPTFETLEAGPIMISMA